MNKIKITKKLRATAYHEAGHAYAHILMDDSFPYVTIKPEGELLGYVKSQEPIDLDNFQINFNFLDPTQIPEFIWNDFIQLSGPIAEKIFTGRWNHRGANSDYTTWSNTTAYDMDDVMWRAYRSFILTYIESVFRLDFNWKGIKSIAEKLLINQTLTYEEARKEVFDSRKRELSMLKGNNNG